MVKINSNILKCVYWMDFYVCNRFFLLRLLIKIFVKIMIHLLSYRNIILYTIGKVRLG